MTATDHDRLLGAWGEMITMPVNGIGSANWSSPMPSSNTRSPASASAGSPNIRRTFEDYPELGAGSTQVDEVIGSPTAYALTPSYTLVGGRRQRRSWGRGQPRPLPRRHRWWALILYELRDGLLDRIRAYFAQDFDPPDWRAPFREAP